MTVKLLHDREQFSWPMSFAELVRYEIGRRHAGYITNAILPVDGGRLNAMSSGSSR